MTDPTAPKPHNSGDIAKLDPKEIQRDLEQQVPSVISRLTEAEKTKLANVVVARTERFSGPIPHPAHLKAYNDIEAGLANRIVAMAEAELAHDQKIHSRMVDEEIEASKRDHEIRLLGMKSARLPVIILPILVACLGYLNQPWLAGLFGAGSIILIAKLFLNSRDSKTTEKLPLPQRQSKQSKKKR